MRRRLHVRWVIKMITSRIGVLMVGKTCLWGSYCMKIKRSIQRSNRTSRWLGDHLMPIIVAASILYRLVQGSSSMLIEYGKRLIQELFCWYNLAVWGGHRASLSLLLVVVTVQAYGLIVLYYAPLVIQRSRSGRRSETEPVMIHLDYILMPVCSLNRDLPCLIQSASSWSAQNSLHVLSLR